MSEINHEKYINEKIRLAIFNLGYLPNGNKDIWFYGTYLNKEELNLTDINISNNV